MHFSGKVGRCDATILLDSGASFNFISAAFIAKNQMKTHKLNGPTVQLADGKIYQCTESLPTANLKIGPYLTKIPLLVLPLIGRDVILGSPWLYTANPSINWRKRSVTLRQFGQEVVLIPETPKTPENPEKAEQLSALQAYHELRRGAKLLLAHVNEVSADYESGPRDDPELQRVAPEPAPSSSSPPPVPSQTDHLLAHLKQKYADVMPADLPHGLPPERSIDHKIELEPGAKPPNQKYYRLSYEEQAECKRQIEEGLSKGHIQPSKSPFGAPVLFVKKKDGTMRMCIDYRALNALTIKNRAPLPNINELLDQVNGAKWFTKLDLRSGYNQIRISPESIPMTAFKTRFGHFQYTVLPFGLCNAPATFQTLMNDIFREYLDQWLIVYLDDTLIASRTLEEHLQHVEIVLRLLRKHHLYIKDSKCDWFKQKLDFLGHVISADGISMDTQKVQSILDWPPLTSSSEVASFLGLAGYYRQFIHQYSHIAAPLTELLKKEIKFVWGPEQQAAFATLKQAIASAPMLQYPDPDKPFIITTDASGKAIGAVLSQDHGTKPQPIAFYSRKLNSAEQNYPVHEREMLALIAALKHWRHYLQGAVRSRAYTDHASLKYFSTQPHLNPRQARWMETLQEFNVYIDYLPGRANVVADALSRRPDLLASITPASTLTDLLTNLKTAYTDTDSMKIMEDIKAGTSTEYQLHNGLILRQNGTNRQIYIPPAATALRTQLLGEHHDSPLAGHLGMDKTYDCLTRNYYWPNLRSDVRNYIKTCSACQANKGRNSKPQGLLQPLPIPQRKWEQVTMDFITQLPKTTAGYDAILVCVDKLTKMVHLAPTHTTATAVDTAELYFDSIVRLHGIQASIISDRDTRFTSRFWEALWQLCGTKLARSTAFHPQTDGQTERTNRTLEEILRAYVDDKHTDWDQRLSAAEFAINNAPSASTGFSPFYLNYGYHPLTPATSTVHLHTRNENQAASDFLSRLSADIHTAKRHLKQAQDRQARNADTKRQDAEFQIGTLVLLSTAHLRLRSDGPAAKFNPRWCGPFKILERIGPVAYRLDLPDTMRIHPVFHVSLLKTYNDSGDDSRPAVRPPPIIGTNIYTVERLLDKRITKHGKQPIIEYLVQWAGYPIYDATWEPTRNLLGKEVLAMKRRIDSTWTKPKP